MEKQMKRIIVLILCVIMLMATLASCKSTEIDPTETPDDTQQSGDTNTPDVTSDDTPAPGVYDVAFATFPPDTVMIRIEGLNDVTWDEIFVYMRSMVGTLSAYYEDDPVNWAAPWDDEITCAEWVLQYAKREALYNKALEYGAGLNGVSLTVYDWASIDEETYNLMIEWGGEEKYLKMLWEDRGFYSLELFEYLMSFNRLTDLLLTAIYGKEFELMTDEEVEGVIADDGFLMVKHIFIIKPEEDDGGDTYERIEDILAELNAYSGDDFVSYFDELMRTYSEDNEGLDKLPDGYLFLYGDLTQYFYDAAMSLEVNELSGVVEGEDGYHIIYRIPINYDAVPFSFAVQEDFRSLRALVASSKFSVLHEGWMNMLEPEFTDELESIDISEMFKRA